MYITYSTIPQSATGGSGGGGGGGGGGGNPDIPIPAGPPNGVINFFISPAGVDTNPGTLAQPWSLSAIKNNQTTYAGKAIGVIGGTYQYVNSGSGQVSIYSLIQASTSTAAIFPLNGGTATNPTWIGSCDSSGHYSPRAAIISGIDPITSSQPTATATLLGQTLNAQPTGGYVTVDALTLTGFTTYGIYFGPGSGGTYPYDPALGGSGGFGGITIVNNQIHNGVAPNGNQNPACIGLDKGLYGALVLNNKLYNFTSTTGNLGDTNGIGTFNVRGCIYAYNTIYNTCNSIHDKTQGGAAGKTGGGNVIAYNYCTPATPNAALNGPGYGNSGETWTAHHNIFDNGPAASAFFSDSSKSAASTLTPAGPIPGYNVLFYNNTCIANYVGGPSFWQEGWGGTTTNYNNIVFDQMSSRNGLMAFQSTVPAPGSVYIGAYNLYGDVNGVCDMGWNEHASYTSLPNIFALAAFQTTTGQDLTSIIGQATYAGATGTGTNAGAYKLAGGSAGTNLGRVGGTSSGAVCNVGAWDGIVTQIGCNF